MFSFIVHIIFSPQLIEREKLLSMNCLGYQSRFLLFQIVIIGSKLRISQTFGNYLLYFVINKFEDGIRDVSSAVDFYKSIP